MEEEIERSAKIYKADGNKNYKESGRRLLHLYKGTGNCSGTDYWLPVFIIHRGKRQVESDKWQVCNMADTIHTDCYAMTFQSNHSSKIINEPISRCLALNTSSSEPNSIRR